MFAVEERIQAPVDVVWEHLVNPDKLAGWMNSVDNLTVRGGAEMATGAELTFTARGAERESQVVEFVECSRLSLRSTQGPITATYLYTLVPDGDVTRARLEAECRATSWGKLMAPLIRVMVRRVDGGQMRDLKDAVERAIVS